MLRSLAELVAQTSELGGKVGICNSGQSSKPSISPNKCFVTWSSIRPTRRHPIFNTTLNSQLLGFLAHKKPVGKVRGKSSTVTTISELVAQTSELGGKVGICNSGQSSKPSISPNKCFVTWSSIRPTRRHPIFNTTLNSQLLGFLAHKKPVGKGNEEFVTPPLYSLPPVAMVRSCI
eukprot:sb/3471917/